jgi:hypothetical protein
MMIAAIFAAALANSVSAPFGVWAHATWAATRPNVELRIENRSKVTAALVDVDCKAYDARGGLVAEPSANLARLQPGEAAHTWATSDQTVAAARFACQISVDHWVKPR